MRKNRKLVICFMLSLALLSGCGTGSKTSDSVSETTSAEAEASDQLYGKVTAIDGKSITIALANMPESGGAAAPSDMPESGDGTAPSDVPESGDGTAPSDMPESGDGTAPSDMPESGDATASSEVGGGTPKSGMSGEQNLDLTGDSKTITLDDATEITVNGESATIDDISVDDVITVEMSGDIVVSISTGMGGGAGNGESQQSADVTAAKEFTDEQTEDGKTYTSETADEAAVLCSDGGSATLTNAVITKSGDTSSTDNSDFYGVNAGIVATANGRIDLSGSKITTNGTGANAVFATGEDSLINVSDVSITTSGDNSRGLDATYGGKIVADTVNITTAGAHCAAVATDRGEGTIDLTNGTLNTSGEGSPCIYSTGEISATKTTGTASGAGLAVVEGSNTITLKECDLTGSGLGRATGGIDNAGVMLYQSTSGDAEEGTAVFTASDSKLTVSSDSSVYDSAPMFFVTNSDAEINLTSTELSFGSGILLSASGNDGEWGSEGSNGGTVTFNADSQTLKGDITADAISSISLSLADSSLEGAINSENTAQKIEVTLDKDSTWNVTADSYVSTLTNADESCDNIISNGHTIYYDASDSANSWLDGKTITLSDGGCIKPVE